LRYSSAIKIYLLMICLALAASLTGQSLPAGHVSGNVVDTVGVAIPRASVFVRSYSDEGERITLASHTDSKGNFTLTLPAGGYDVLVSSPGFQSKLQIIVLKTGKNTRMQWKLIPEKCDFPGVNCDTVQ